MRFAPGGRGHGRQRDKGSVVEVHFQTAHFGWNTDDLLVVGLRPATSQFWFLWRMFADKGRDARWLTRIDEKGREPPLDIRPAAPVELTLDKCQRAGRCPDLVPVDHRSHLCPDHSNGVRDGRDCLHGVYTNQRAPPKCLGSARRDWWAVEDSNLRPAD